MVHLKVLELCSMKLMVQIYTTGPKMLLAHYIIAQIGVLGVLGVLGVWRNRRIGVIGLYIILLYILILVWLWDP